MGIPTEDLNFQTISSIGISYLENRISPGSFQTSIINMWLSWRNLAERKRKIEDERWRQEKESQSHGHR